MAGPSVSQNTSMANGALTCNNCNRTFIRNYDLNRHLQILDSKGACPKDQRKSTKNVPANISGVQVKQDGDDNENREPVNESQEQAANVAGPSVSQNTPVANGALTCSNCNRTFQQNYGLKRHLQALESKGACPKYRVRNSTKKVSANISAVQVNQDGDDNEEEQHDESVNDDSSSSDEEVSDEEFEVIKPFNVNVFFNMVYLNLEK